MALTEIKYNATSCEDLNFDDHVFFKAGQSGEGITVTVGANVKKIPAYLFCYYINSDVSYSLKIASVVFEEGSVCESIGSYAFKGCDSLISIEMPDSVIEIGSYAFSNCTRLNYNEYGNCKYLGSAQNPYFALIAVVNTNYSSYIIHENTKFILSEAFYNCSRMTSVVIPNSVMSIGDYAFYNCDSLTSVEIPNSVTNIGYEAFCACSGLTSVEIGDSVTTIGGGAFRSCSRLTSVVIGNSVTSIGYSAFKFCYRLTSVVIPDSVTSIGNEAFYDCYRLVEVINKSSHITVDKYVDSNGYVGYYALSVSNRNSNYVSKLTNDNGYIIYTDGEEKILVGNFGTETDLVLSNYITKINQYAFYYCSSLTSVVIPDSVIRIGEYAFQYCSGLTSVMFKDTTTWYYGNYNISVTDSLQNAKYLNTYNLYDWYKR